MDDRRKFFRFNSPLKVKYTLDNDKTSGKSETTSVSRGGVSFATDRMLAAEDSIRMDFEIPGDNMPVFARGMVAWIKEVPNKKKKTYSIGIKLTDMARIDKAKVLDYAYKKWLQKKRTA